jgi:hypothetical protein
MKRLFIYLAVISLVSFMSTLPALAQHGHGGSHGQSGSHGQQADRSQGRSDMSRGMEHQGMRDEHKPELEMESHGSSEHAQNSASELLQQDSKLSEKLQSRLPAGTDVNQAAEGFGNLGQFVAAVNVSHNLGIPFSDLKGQLDEGKSLGEAIHELKPDVDAQAEAKKAEAQAKKDLKKGS